MNYINVLREDDFLKLTTHDIKQLEKTIEMLKEVKSDKKEWLFKNIKLLENNEDAKNIISNKILAGRTTIKLFRIKLIYNKKTILERLQSDKCNFLKNSISESERISIYSTIKINENKYIIRVRYDNGIRKHLGKEFEDIKFIDAVYYVDKNIVEVRGDTLKSSKIIKFLGVELQFTYDEVKILQKHKDIEAFAKSIDGNFKKLSSNTAIDISELKEEDLISLGELVIALDNYLLDKDEVTFLDKVKSSNFINGNLTFTQAFLAGCKQLRITVSNDDDGDVLNQGLYKVLSKYLNNDNGYITLKSDDKKQEYTIRVSTKSNTIQFVSSVDEKIISKIIDNIVSYKKVDSFDIEKLSKEIDVFIKNKAVKSIRKEHLVEKFGVKEEIIESILNTYIEKGLLYSKIEVVSPITEMVITELDNEDQIKDNVELLLDDYDVSILEEEGIEEFLDCNKQFIYTSYYIDRENIEEFNTYHDENTRDIAIMLEEQLNENETIFTKKKTFLDRIKKITLNPKSKGILN